MPRTKREAYIIQPFWRRGARLAKGTATRHEDETLATLESLELSWEAAGVVLLAVEVAPEVDYIGKPRVLARWGEVIEGCWFAD